MSEYSEFVGVDNLHIAVLTADTAEAYTAETPEYFAPTGRNYRRGRNQQDTYIL